jgi:hypothetical protein
MSDDAGDVRSSTRLPFGPQTLFEVKSLEVDFAVGIDRRAALREHVLEPVDALFVGRRDDKSSLTSVDGSYSQGRGVLQK